MPRIGIGILGNASVGANNSYFTNVVVCDPVNQVVGEFDVIPGSSGYFFTPTLGSTTTDISCSVGHGNNIQLKWDRNVDNGVADDAQVSLVDLTAVAWFVGKPSAGFSNTTVKAFGSTLVDFRTLYACNKVMLSDEMSVSWAMRDWDISITVYQYGVLGWYVS